MKQYVRGAWHGWSGKTEVQLTDGSVWRQSEYYYEYFYAYYPEVTVTRGNMLVLGMSRPIPVRQVR